MGFLGSHAGATADLVGEDLRNSLKSAKGPLLRVAEVHSVMLLAFCLTIVLLSLQVTLAARSFYL